MNTADLGNDWVGRKVDGRYPLLRWLGGAGSDGVFLTEAPELGLRQAAIRLVLAQSESAQERAAGWQAAAGLEHPHLVRVLETGACRVDDAAVLYCVTEYADEALGEVLRERALTSGEARKMLGPLVNAIEYLHGQGFVHGRLRPAKILAANDSLKLSLDGVQRAGTVNRGGADAYAAPEAAQNTPAGDVWRLGVTLVEALTQQAPEWDAPGGGVPALVEGLPEPFARIARECLRGDPAKRCTLARVRELLAGGAETVAVPETGQDSGLDRGLERGPEHGPERKLDREPAAPADSPDAREKSDAIRRARLAGVVLLGLFAAVGVWLHSRQTTGPAAGKAPNLPAAAGPAAPGTIPAPEPSHGAQSSAAPARHGAVVARVMPDVPEQAMQTIHGTVRFSVRVTVNAEGTVSGASIERAGTSPYFLPFGLKAARQWRFAPAYAGGQAVPSVWVLQFDLRKDGIDAHPEEVAP